MPLVLMYWPSYLYVSLLAIYLYIFISLKLLPPLQLSSQLYFKVPDMTLSGCCVDQHSVQVYSSAKPRIVTCKLTEVFLSKYLLYTHFLKVKESLSYFQPENFNPKSTSYGIQQALLRYPLGR